MLLFLGIAPSVALLLLWCGTRRAFRETSRRGRITLALLAAIALWLAASNFMLEMVFGTAWGLAHARPFPDGLFPEGWPVYAWLAAYAASGAVLVWILGKLPPTQTRL